MKFDVETDGTELDWAMTVDLPHSEMAQLQYNVERLGEDMKAEPEQPETADDVGELRTL